MADPYAVLGTQVDPYAALGEPVAAAPKSASGQAAPQPPRSRSQDAAGALATLYRSIPFADEINDSLYAAGKTAGDLLTGKARLSPADLHRGLLDLNPFDNSVFRKNYAAAQARGQDAAQGFQAAHPTAANLTKGAGLAAQVAPALLSAGATAVPEIAATPARGLMAATARAVKPLAHAATTAGLYAQAGALGGEGTLPQRVQAANAATLPAMAVGAAIPPALMVGGAAANLAGNTLGGVGRTVARAANKASGGLLLNPEREAMSRLARALQQDGLSPSDIDAGLQAWQETGASAPALMDLAGENTRALLRTVASQPGAARNLAQRLVKTREGALQDNVINRTGRLAPSADTIPDTDVTPQMIAATTGDADLPQPGTGGAAVHQALNEAYDTAKTGVDQAYAAARAADPQGAHVPAAELPNIAANLREAVRDFHPADMPSVARELSGLDNVATPTVRDLFELRSRLSNLRVGQPTPQTVAAGRAVNALDSSIDSLADDGRITGDPQIVGLWRQAIGARRGFGRQFEGDDLIQRLTERGAHGAGRTNLVAPEDASDVILGRNGVLPRQNLFRDLSRLRDTLGAGSPAWRAIQSEAAGRLLGRDAGTEAFGSSLQAFGRRNPQLGSLLVRPEQTAGVQLAQARIANAAADRAAAQTGQDVLSAMPDTYAADAATLEGRRPLAQIGAVRQVQNQVGKPAAGASGLLNRIETGPNIGQNFEALFGPQEAQNYRAAVGREVEKLQNARFIAPNSGPKTANLILDALVNPPADLPVTKLGIIRAIWDKIRSGATLTDAEREAMLRIATTPVRTSADVPDVPLLNGQTRKLISATQRARYSRALAGAAGAATARAR